MLFHSSLSLGRTDTVICEALSKDKLLEFFNTVSQAVVRNIKEIVFSKDYNLNYVSKVYVPEDVYQKVIIQALSTNYSETYILFNIKKSVTQKDIENKFKLILINNEPIIDFVSITFYDKGDSPTNINNLYQVQYKRNSKTYIENFYAKKWQDVYTLSSELIGGEITEIRKFVHYDSRIKKDIGDGYYKSVNVSLNSDFGHRNIKIPKVSYTISVEELQNYIVNTFKVFGKSINKSEIKLKYS